MVYPHGFNMVLSVACRPTPRCKVIDASWYLPAMGRDARGEYATHRILGARFIDLDNTDDTSGLDVLAICFAFLRWWLVRRPGWVGGVVTLTLTKRNNRNAAA